MLRIRWVELTGKSPNQSGRLELRNETEGGGATQAIGKQHPIEMVAFVLHHQGREALNHLFDGLPIAVEPLNAQATPLLQMPMTWPLGIGPR
jgi:hypothetical protein